MEFSAVQIAELLGGEIEGNPNVFVNTLSKIDEGKPKSLSFLANPAYTAHIYETKASIVFKKLPEIQNKINELEKGLNSSKQAVTVISE